MFCLFLVWMDLSFTFHLCNLKSPLIRQSHRLSNKRGFTVFVLDYALNKWHEMKWNSDDSRRFRMIPGDSGRFRAIPGDSGQFRSNPDNSGRFQRLRTIPTIPTIPGGSGLSDWTYPSELGPKFVRIVRTQFRFLCVLPNSNTDQ